MKLELEHFGRFLKKRREARGLSLAALSRATKIKETSLALLEEARLEALPAQVFVRGFVRAYAREVGADEMEALRRYRAHLHAAGVERAPVEAEMPLQARFDDGTEPLAADRDRSGLDGESESGAGGNGNGSGAGPLGIERRRFGVVMVVLLVLVVATLTLSLLLRHGRAAGPGLSSISPAARLDRSSLPT
ncbi:MAG: helix-turn-helix domain-containing protein [Polyangia bacterium]